MRLPAKGAVMAAAVVAGGLAGGCGSTGATPILDTERVERAIEQSSLAQRGLVPRVTCPSGVRQKKGVTFTCTAVVKRSSTAFAVTALDGAGRVHFEAR